MQLVKEGLRGRPVAEILSDYQLCFDFTKRAFRMSNELAEFAPRQPSLTFREITGDRNRCAA